MVVGLTPIAPDGGGIVVVGGGEVDVVLKKPKSGSGGPVTMVSRNWPY